REPVQNSWMPDQVRHDKCTFNYETVNNWINFHHKNVIMKIKEAENISRKETEPRNPDQNVVKKGKFYVQRFLLILLVVLLLPLSSSVAKNITCSRLPLLMKSFLANHYAMKDLTGGIKDNAVDQMIKIMDPTKMLLYESDVTSLKPFLRQVFASIQAGDCASLTPVYEILVTRAKENEAIVKKILGSGYQLDEKMELQIDVKKRPYIKTRREKEDLLKKVVQFQIENNLLAGISLAEAKKQQIHRYELQTIRIIKRNPEKLVTSAAEAFAQALDPHTSYMSPESFDDFRIQMQLSLEGIGAVLSSDNGFTVIEELIPGGGAERSGLLKPKDKIVAVAQKNERPVNVIDMDLRDVVKMIRGKKGTQVTLTVLRQAERTFRFDVTIKRDKVYLKEQEAKISYETRSFQGKQYKFGVIDLPSFYGDEKTSKSCYEDVKELIADARRQRVDGIVLDLSRNGGGLLGEAVRIAGLFLGKGAVVATKDSQGLLTIFINGSSSTRIKGDDIEVIAFPAEEPQDIFNGPLVVLTSRLSASASEIVAGALQDYNRAVIVGSDHTFGKGSVQTLSRLPRDLGGMRVTTALYFLPRGKSTQKIGVGADVRVPGLFLFEDIGETTLEYPLPAQAISSFIDMTGKSTPVWKPLDKAIYSELAVKSVTRVSKDEKFTEIIKNNKEAAAKKGVIKITDFRKEMEKENGGAQKESPSEMKKKAREQYAPYINESINVLIDMIMMGRNQSVPQAIQAKAPGR
ncbi:MAG: S41 family peptidase, partial [Smithella sp.]